MPGRWIFPPGYKPRKPPRTRWQIFRDFVFVVVMIAAIGAMVYNMLSEIAGLFHN